MINSIPKEWNTDALKFLAVSKWSKRWSILSPLCLDTISILYFKIPLYPTLKSSLSLLSSKNCDPLKYPISVNILLYLYKFSINIFLRKKIANLREELIAEGFDLECPSYESIPRKFIIITSPWSERVQKNKEWRD